MIQIEKILLGQIPTLYVCQSENVDAESPCVIILHGVTNAKEDNLHYAFLMAERGFKVFLPDAQLHGERGHGVNDHKRTFALWDTVLCSIQELSTLKEAIIQQYAIDDSKIILGGISMGAITTYGALTQYPWISAAFSMMGSPAYLRFSESLYHSFDERVRKLYPPIDTFKQMLSPYDLTTHLDKLAGRPLFIWHGDADDVVPIQDDLAFVKQLQADNPHQEVELVVEKDRAHKVNRSGYLKLITWLEHLSKR